MERRRFLVRVGTTASATAGLAGCLGRDGDPAPSNDVVGTTEPFDDEQNDDAESFADHSATDAIDAQPFFGPEPGTATGTIVAFSDPSCPACAAFERETVPKIRSELAEPGDATYVFRGYPVVYPWGESATKALEATFARDEDAHWSLLEHYMENQSQFSADGVLDATADYLASTTGVDGEAVAADVREGSYDDQVRTDLDAGQAAGAGGATPTVFLFRDGEYRTKARGSVSFSVVKNALEL